MEECYKNNKVEFIFFLLEGRGQVPMYAFIIADASSLAFNKSGFKIRLCKLK